MKRILIYGAIALIGSLIFFNPYNGLVTNSLTTGKASHKVIYRVVPWQCTEFDLTMRVPNGTSQKTVRTCANNNVVAEFDGQRGDFLSLSAQNAGDSDNRTIFSCQIEVNGKIIVQVESEGFASIASCSGSIP